MKFKECIGCGFCCKKAPCAAALRIYGNGVTECPALIWDGKRYWCDLCQQPSGLGERYKEELAIGGGCCATLNSDRQNIPSPKPKIKTYSKEVQILLKHLGGYFINPDALWLAIDSTSKELNDPCFRKQALYWLKEQRNQHQTEFMGELEETPPLKKE